MQHLEREDAEPSGAPNSTVNPAAMPAMVRTRDSRTTRPAVSAVHDARVPVVCTSGASGPIPPPDAMQSHEIGISERSIRTPVAVPDTWMLSTMSSTSPGLPTNFAIRAATRPTPPRMAKPTAPLHSVGQSTCCSRWSTSR